PGDEEPGDEELEPVAPAAPEADDEDSFGFQDAGELNGDADLLAADEELEAEGELVQEEDEEARDWVEEEGEEAESLAEQPEDPNAAKRFWFEHATGAGKTVAALGFVEASRSGGVLILTHRRNLVDQFLGELRDRGYKKRIRTDALVGRDKKPREMGPVTVETYQW